jgi:DNA (cytosine-5)-methyltransferase 1
MKKLTAIDLFSGCGGLTLGLKLAGFSVKAAVENDPLAVRTYKANHRRVRVCAGDIRAVKARTLMKELGMKPGDLDLLAGCPPCQGFSVLRTRNGAKQRRDIRNGLIQDMLRFIRAFRPKTIMMENVPGLGEHWLFHNFCRALRKFGYRVHWDVKDASRFRVPQRRKRLILLAGRALDIPFAEESTRLCTVKQTIGRLSKPGRSYDALHNLPENRTAKTLKLIKAIPKDGGSRSDLPHRLQLECHKRSDGFKDIYGRMAWGKPAPTITGGCFNPSKGRFLHPEANRAITLREAALLQTFPKKYRFPTDVSKEQVALMIGNALPPVFIEQHAEEIAKTLRGAKDARR